MVKGMYALLYFDTEDFFSAPDSPSHTLPGQLAAVMRRHGLQGCFHIHGERVRFWERHGMTDVIEAIRWHDVSLHYDRGSIHPTTAEEVSELDWFQGVERTLFRELPGVQTLERVFGKCSGLTQHGGTFAAQIVYAIGKLGKPFFYSPFRLPGRNVVWYCNNLLIGGYQAPFYFDPHYRDTPTFEATLAKVNPYLDERAAAYDFTAMFGCHPVITVMQKFPDAINFRDGATPLPKDWVAPTLVPGVSIPLVLENFERLVKTLVSHPKVEWTTVAGIQTLYGQRPARVSDRDVLAGATAVVANGGPTFSPLLSAAELLVLLARRALAPAPSYDVPQVMGPADGPRDASASAIAAADIRFLASDVLAAVMASGYLPAQIGAPPTGVTPEAALLRLACHAAGAELPPAEERQLTVEAIPGVKAALQNVRRYKDWCIHGPRYHPEAIQSHFLRQCWTLKPAYTAPEYGPGVSLGRHVNPMFETRW